MGTNHVGLPANSLEESSTTLDERQFQKDTVADIERNPTPYVEGEHWYLISAPWYKRWKEYTLDIATYKPGPIDNNHLIDASGRLNKFLSENIDFLVISKQHWETLFSWYGGGPEISRKVTSNAGLYQTSLVVEIYPLTVKVVKSSDIHTKNPVIEQFSKSDTVGTLKARMCEKMGLDPEKIRVWDYYSGSYMKLLTDPNQRLDSAQILDDQLVLLEEKNADGTWPDRFGMSSYPPRINYSNYNDQVPTTPGQTGLCNLGNTCFMNSAIQCLSNTVAMKQYLVSGDYQKDVNSTNPLGMKGELAEQFANLLKELWSGSYSAVAPREFKSKLERFAPQFVGYQQQDSQELLAFLLDGLHEDLNRVKQKPYIEAKEFPEGTPDAEIASESWKTHLARNNSVIVDWFHGQYKSTLVCPECNKISITFDPFMYLSLPIPQKTTRRMQVTLLRQAVPPQKVNPQPIRYAVTVPKNGNVADLKAALREKAGLPKNTELAIADVYNSRFFKNFTDNDLLEIIQERDVIIAYELVNGVVSSLPSKKEVAPEVQQDGESTAPAKDKDGDVQIGESEDEVHDVVVSILLRYEEQIHSVYYGSTTVRRNAFGIPRILKLPSRLSREQLYTHLLLQLYYNLNINSLPAREKKIFKEFNLVPSNDNLTNDISSNTSSSDTEMEIDQQEEEQPIFHILFVDQNGGNESEPQGDEISFNHRRSLAISWSYPAWKKYYVESTNDIISDESLSEEQQRDENVCSLQKCLDLFTTVEKLGPEDPWYCNKCKEFRQATKKFDLWKLPSLLVIHLKRFSYRNRFWRDRLDTLIDFPMTGLDLSSHVINPDTNKDDTLYDLYAVSNHYGTMAGGHYTAYAKNESGKWYRFDDRSVSAIDESTVKSSAAYVLFYQRRGSFPATSTSSSQQTPTPDPE